MGGSFTKTDIGHGRGWLAPAPAASVRRIDAQLGRLADINEAGRSPEKANENRRKWLAYERYLNGGPWAPKAPYALGADESVHCWGYAADSDDWYNAAAAAAAAVWRDNGWRQTARYPGNKAKDEPWHGEYDERLDNRKNDPAFAGGSTEEDDMPTIGEVFHTKIIVGPDGADISLAEFMRYAHLWAARATWEQPLVHAIEKRPVSAGDLLRYEPAEHEGTRRAVAKVGQAVTPDIDYAKVVAELKAAGLDPQKFAVYAADEADRRERERLAS